MKEIIKIVVNPFSGRSMYLWKKIEERIKALGVAYDYAVTKNVTEARRFVAEAIENGCRKIFIVGGDGSINGLINGTQLKETALGIIPAGCGNDFSKMLGIHNIGIGIDSVISETRMLVDVGIANGRHFINNLGVGIDAHVVFMKNKFKKFKFQHMYLLPTLMALFSYKPFRLDIESDSFSYSGEVLGVSVGNGKYHGGIFCLTPQAVIDDGLLDICIITKIGPAKRFLNVCRAIRGTHIFLDEVKTFRAKKFFIHSQKPFFTHIDGDHCNEPLQTLEVVARVGQVQFLLPPA